jgi:hypothetical protein
MYVVFETRTAVSLKSTVFWKTDVVCFDSSSPTSLYGQRVSQVSNNASLVLASFLLLV